MGALGTTVVCRVRRAEAEAAVGVFSETGRVLQAVRVEQQYPAGAEAEAAVVRAAQADFFLLSQRARPAR